MPPTNAIFILHARNPALTPRFRRRSFTSNSSIAAIPVRTAAANRRPANPCLILALGINSLHSRLGPDSDHFFWREHETHTSFFSSSFPGACSQLCSLHVCRAGEIFQTCLRHDRQLHRSLQLRHVLSLLLQHPFHKSYGRASYE